MTASYLQGSALHKLLGIRVDRAAATTPQTTATAYFTVAGGRVLVVGFLAEVTVIMTGTASSLKPVANPTVGTSVDMAAAVAMANKEAGTLLGITGLPADAMVATNAGLAPWMSRGLVIPVGTIDIDASGSNATGEIKWSLWYVPIDTGASVVSA